MTTEMTMIFFLIHFQNVADDDVQKIFMTELLTAIRDR